jgi:hypothetical protein
MTDVADTLEAAFAQALARVQMTMPKIGKSNTATVPTKAGGSYTYKYADLADIFEKVMPLLAANGLAWIATPTLSHGDAFVLRYALLHKDGHREAGEYPLPHPSSGTPQSIGSAITYARRYAFCAMVGVVADVDDDGKAAAQPLPRPRQATKPVVDGSAASLPVPPATFPPTFPARAAHLDKTTGELTAPTAARSSTSKPVNAAQLKMMMSLFNKSGVTDRTERLTILAGIVDRDVESAKDLDVAEASKVINSLLDEQKGRVEA